MGVFLSFSRIPHPQHRRGTSRTPQGNEPQHRRGTTAQRRETHRPPAEERTATEAECPEAERRPEAAEKKETHGIEPCVSEIRIVIRDYYHQLE